MGTGRRRSFAGLVILGLAGVTAVALATRFGVGLTPDSSHYLDAARHLAAGDGLVVELPPDGRVPLTHFPPLFPSVLAALALLGIDPLAGARAVNACLFGLGVLLVGLLLRRGHDVSEPAWIPPLGALLVLSSVDLLRVHAMAWSEPLLLVSGFAGLGCLAAHFANPRPRWLLAASIALSLAFLARYAGGAFLLSGLLAILLWDAQPVRTRVRHASLVGVLALTPMALWLARGLLVSGSVADRGLAWHPVGLEPLGAASETVARWLLPAAAPVPLGALLAAGLYAAALHHGLRRAGSAAPSRERFGDAFAFLLGVFLVVYPASLLVSISFVDRHTPLDFRILSPVLVAGIALLLDALRRRLRGRGTRPYRLAAAAICLAAVLGSAVRAGGWIRASYLEGQTGFTNRKWSASGLMRRVKALPPDALLYSNGANVIQVLTGRPARPIPGRVRLRTGRRNAAFEAEMRALERGMLEDGALLVWFDTLPWLRHVPGQSELAERLSLRAVDGASDGAIYRVDRRPDAPRTRR